MCIQALERAIDPGWPFGGEYGGSAVRNGVTRHGQIGAIAGRGHGVRDGLNQIAHAQKSPLSSWQAR